MRVKNLLENLPESALALLPRRAPFMALVDDVLSPAECDALVARIEALSPAFAPITTMRGFEARPDVRNNDRVMFDDLELAARLFQRLLPLVPPQMFDGDEPVTPVGLNERFRGYRYSPGHRFRPHFDGAYVRNERERSQLTVLFYLNDGFTGGATAFNDWEVSVDPRRGQALLFYHPVLHEGCLVEAGRKYVLRSDVMYRWTRAAG